MTADRPLSVRQERALLAAARGFVSLYTKASMPSLVSRGLVRRETSWEGGRRRFTFTLTDDGRVAAAAIRQRGA